MMVAGNIVQPLKVLISWSAVFRGVRRGADSEAVDSDVHSLRKYSPQILDPSAFPYLP